MGTKRLSISWRNGAPYCPDVSVNQNEGSTDIEWTAASGSGITSFSIVGLDSTEFTGGRNSSGSTPTLTVTDRNNSSSDTDYNYTISATHQTEGDGSHDPKISNIGRPGT